MHSDLSEKQREYVELEQSFKFTNQTLNETKHRMELAEDELRQMQRDYPALRTEVESLRRQNGTLSDQLKNNEMNAGSINFKMEQLSTENEKLRNEVLAANMKIQEHLGSVRVAETNNEHFRKSYEKEKERSEKLRSDLDETKLERNELIRDKEDAQVKIICFLFIYINIFLRCELKPRKKNLNALNLKNEILNLKQRKLFKLLISSALKMKTK